MLASVRKMSKKLCLQIVGYMQWKEVNDNIMDCFRSLKEHVYFAHVTLACEDDQQLEALKVVLASSSPVFQNILKRNKHSHPILHMRGMNFEDLSAIQTIEQRH